jgi:hypothetical protein
VITILCASRESYIRALGFALKLLLKYKDLGAKIVPKSNISRITLQIPSILIECTLERPE